MDVQVDYRNLIFLLFLDRFALRLVGSAFHAQSTLKVAAINHHLLRRHIAPDNVDGNHRIVEIFVVVEAMQPMELRGVEPMLNQRRILRRKRFVDLKGDVLHSHAVYVANAGKVKFLHHDLYVRLHHAVVARGPLAGVLVAREIGEIKEIIAVVHQIGIICGGVKVLEFLCLIAQHHVQHVAGRCFLDGQVGWRSRFCARCRHLLAFCLRQRTVVSRGTRLGSLHHHQLAQQCRRFKPILIFNVCQFAFDAANAAASHLIQESNNIVNFCHDMLFA